MMTAFKHLVAAICLVLATQTTAQEDDLALVLRDAVALPLSQLPDYVPVALVATEDKDFYDKPAWKSPITAHLARLTLGAEKGDVGFHRIQRSFDLAETVGHDGIVEAYLNLVFYGRDATGIEAAAQAYFGKPAHDLTPSEAIYLAMLVKAPSAIQNHTEEQQIARYEHLRETVLELKVLDMRATTHLTLSQMPTPLPQD